MKKILTVFIVSSLTLCGVFAAEELKPVLNFDFQKTTPKTVTSVSGENLIGTASSEIIIVEDDKFGKCMEFKNRTFLTIASDKLPVLDKDFTISLNVKINSFSGWEVIAAKESWTAKTGWFIFNTKQSLLVFVNSRQVLSIKSPFLDKKWHNITVVFATGKMITYIDGKLISENNATPKTNDVPLYFGARHGNSGKGSTDYLKKSLMTDIKIFDKALSSSEVIELTK